MESIIKRVSLSANQENVSEMTIYCHVYAWSEIVFVALPFHTHPKASCHEKKRAKKSSIYSGSVSDDGCISLMRIGLFSEPDRVVHDKITPVVICHESIIQDIDDHDNRLSPDPMRGGCRIMTEPGLAIRDQLIFDTLHVELARVTRFSPDHTFSNPILFGKEATTGPSTSMLSSCTPKLCKMTCKGLLSEILNHTPDHLITLLSTI